MHDGKDGKGIEAVQKVVQRLADARLVITSLDKGEESVKIIHDSLIREWARLQRWLKKDRAFLSWQRELERDAQERISQTNRANDLYLGVDYPKKGRMVVI